MIQRLGRSSPLLKELRRRAHHRRPGEVVVDGRRLVEDLVRWRVPLRELYLTAELAPELADWAPIATADAVFEVDGAVLAGIAPTRHPQGVLAVVDEPEAGRWPDGGVTVFVDGVQDPGNLGAIVRAAAALGAGAVLVAPGSADPFHPMAVRGSAGTVFRLAMARDVTPVAAAAKVRAAGGSVWASGAAGVPVNEWEPRPPVLLLLGSEGTGLGEEARGAVDDWVTVPLGREVESLNVAVAAGILLQRLRALAD